MKAYKATLVSLLLGLYNGRANGQSAVKQAYFDQLIDHDHPELGTWKQEYWYSTEYYGGPGHPILFDAPVEVPITLEYVTLSNKTMAGALAQDNNAAAVKLQHRFMGKPEYSPTKGKQYNTETLQLLNIRQSIKDMTYFAKNAVLPFDPSRKSAPDKAPWIFQGCSYAGALSAWVHQLEPGVFWTHYCSSAVVQSVSEYWEYFVPSLTQMPRNCTLDLKRIIKYVDDAFFNGTEQDQAKVREDLGMPANLSKLDVGSMVSFNNWQLKQSYPGADDWLQTECDVIENQCPRFLPNCTPPSNEPAGPDGVGLEKALQGMKYFLNVTYFGGSWNGFSLEQPRSSRSSLFSRFSAPHRTSSASTLNPKFLFDWMLCNDAFEWWKIWNPKIPEGMVSKILTRELSINHTCESAFPDVNGFKYGIKEGRSAATVNSYTGGWDATNTTRLLWINGELDPWRGATVSSQSRPGGPLKSTKQAPVFMLPGASHCNDEPTWYILEKDKTLGPIVKAAMAQIKEWVKEFPSA